MPNCKETQGRGFAAHSEPEAPPTFRVRAFNRILCCLPLRIFLMRFSVADPRRLLNSDCGEGGGHRCDTPPMKQLLGWGASKYLPASPLRMS